MDLFSLVPGVLEATHVYSSLLSPVAIVMVLFFVPSVLFHSLVSDGSSALDPYKKTRLIEG